MSFLGVKVEPPGPIISERYNVRIKTVDNTEIVLSLDTLDVTVAEIKLSVLMNSLERLPLLKKYAKNPSHIEIIISGSQFEIALKESDILSNLGIAESEALLFRVKSPLPDADLSSATPSVTAAQPISTIDDVPQKRAKVEFSCGLCGTTSAKFWTRWHQAPLRLCESCYTELRRAERPPHTVSLSHNGGQTASNMTSPPPASEALSSVPPTPMITAPTISSRSVISSSSASAEPTVLATLSPSNSTNALAVSPSNLGSTSSFRNHIFHNNAIPAAPPSKQPYTRLPVPSAPVGSPQFFNFSILSQRIPGVVLAGKRYLFLAQLLRAFKMATPPLQMQRAWCDLSRSQNQELRGLVTKRCRRLVSFEEAEACVMQREAKRKEEAFRP